MPGYAWVSGDVNFMPCILQSMLNAVCFFALSSYNSSSLTRFLLFKTRDNQLTRYILKHQKDIHDQWLWPLLRHCTYPFCACKELAICRYDSLALPMESCSYKMPNHPYSCYYSNYCNPTIIFHEIRNINVNTCMRLLNCSSLDWGRYCWIYRWNL